MAPEMYDLTRLNAAREDDPTPVLGVTHLRLGDLHRIANAAAIAASLAKAVGRIIEERPGKFSLTSHQIVHLALRRDECVGLSVIEPEGDHCFDALTWTAEPFRHRGIATALKRVAVCEAKDAGYIALWAPGDAASEIFYMGLGLTAD